MPAQRFCHSSQFIVPPDPPWRASNPAAAAARDGRSTGPDPAEQPARIHIRRKHPQMFLGFIEPDGGS